MITARFKIGDKIYFRPDLEPRTEYWNTKNHDEGHCFKTGSDISYLLDRSWTVTDIIEGYRSQSDFWYKVLSDDGLSCAPVESALLSLNAMFCNSLI